MFRFRECNNFEKRILVFAVAWQLRADIKLIAFCQEQTFLDLLREGEVEKQKAVEELT